MKITAIFLFLGLVTLLVLMSCNRKAKTTIDENTKPIILSKEVSLKLNEEATTKDGKFTVKPMTVKDSRCPKGVQCIRAGEVFVGLWMKTDAKEETLKMATPSTKRAGGLDQITFDGYTVKLVNVLPFPEQPAPADAPETTVVLVIEKK